MSPEEKNRLDEKMGLRPTSYGVANRGRSQYFGVPIRTPNMDEIRIRLQAIVDDHKASDDDKARAAAALKASK